MLSLGVLLGSFQCYKRPFIGEYDIKLLFSFYQQSKLSDYTEVTSIENDLLTHNRSWSIASLALILEIFFS